MSSGQRRKRKRKYKIVGALDTETTNIANFDTVAAFPVCYQLGITDADIYGFTPANVENLVYVSVYRDIKQLEDTLFDLIDRGKSCGYIPVIMVHNLGFDMYSLTPFLERFDIDILAKSSTKPLSFKVLQDGAPVLVFWDTLTFYQKPLSKMGSECGYRKLVGDWDYSLIRTPYTELTDSEYEYATHDIYVMFVYLSYWLKRNPMISGDDLASLIFTKTGVVRSKRVSMFSQLKNGRKNVGSMWRYHNITQKPKSDDELSVMHAATRGGFTFCSSVNAGRIFAVDGTGYCIAGYDATSQHPAQMVSHLYPVDFQSVAPDIIDLDRRIVETVDTGYILDNWARPFPVAFYANFRFYGLKPRKDSIFERFGIFPLALARVKDMQSCSAVYSDKAVNYSGSFGKLERADIAELYLTELGYWEVYNAYEWDSVEVIGGYSTMKYAKPTDLSILSVMGFYANKDTFKEFLNVYEHGEPVTDELKDRLSAFMPSDFMQQLDNGTLDDRQNGLDYLALKADLNALFGIEATNEARPDAELSIDGISFKDSAGLDDLPQKPKAWYQFGQRIVGWSRIAQIVFMNMVSPFVETIINGDTDSCKFLVHETLLDEIDDALSVMSDAIDRGKSEVTARVKRLYPDRFNPLHGIGHYVREFVTYRFSAGWNKAYIMQNDDRFDITIAGIPSNVRSSDRADSLQDFADYLYSAGWSFSAIASLIIGYNVTIDHSITKANGRKIPRWGSWFYQDVTDYKGDTYKVDAPAALALYPMPKTIGDTSNKDNAVNMAIAKANNPDINTDRVILAWFDKPEIIYL